MAAHVTSKVFQDSRFWRQYRLVHEFATPRAYIWADRNWVRGRETRKAGSAIDAETAAAITDTDVYAAIKDMDLSNFHSERSEQEILHNIRCDRRLVFKGIGKIKGVKLLIELVDSSKPVCCRVRRRSPPEEKIERAAMQKLLKLVVVEPAT